MKKARLKILHVVFSLEPGGMENGLVNIARRLDPEEFEIHVCCLERGGAFVERLIEPGNLSILNKDPGFSPRIVYQLARVISRVKPHVVHSHNLGPLIYSSLATAMGLSHPLLHGEHGIPVAQRKKKFMRQRRFFYRCCKRVQAVSRGLRQDLIDFGMPAEKIIVVLNGIETERFAPLPSQIARERIRLPLQGPVLGIVGRFDRSKRHLDVIEAFNHLSKEFPSAQLLMVGDGGDIRAEVISRVASSPAANRIHLAGFQKEPQIFYPAMDLLVSTSISEGLSNVILEAMSCGIPVLAHTACGNSELIINGENGITTDLATVDDLLKALKNILADSEKLSRMGQSARKHVVEHFFIEGAVQNYAKLYREMAGQKFNST